MASPTTTRRHASWKELCADPALQDLPYKIETNVRGQLVMSPTHLWHGALQVELASLLKERLARGQTVTKCAVETRDGTKVAEVAWFSSARWDEVKDAAAAPVAPEICIEILSPTNTEKEMAEKRALYFEAGAEEVWLCDREGCIRFFDQEGFVERSSRASNFPHKIDL